MTRLPGSATSSQNLSRRPLISAERGRKPQPEHRSLRSLEVKARLSGRAVTNVILSRGRSRQKFAKLENGAILKTARERISKIEAQAMHLGTLPPNGRDLPGRIYEISKLKL